ncbi:hypothetical protein [Clostridium sp. Cult1]|jgi:membrane protease YdiL (CAAX protease family)|uniref:hypothetical protein n=1 Tax=Clostridium sp. Cult1 TaxID=2079002 RepID=UPI001F32E340|nr:hypothetical protein [Clostridium sp. Cult1]
MIIAFFISTIVFAAAHVLGRKWYSMLIHLPISAAGGVLLISKGQKSTVCEIA